MLERHKVALTQAFALAITVGFGTLPALAQDGATLTVATPGEPPTMLPRAACGSTTDIVMDGVWEQLTYRADDGSLIGQLAESFERIDDLTWRFKIRSGVQFSNGEPLNAHAVATSINYIMNPQFESSCRSSFDTVSVANQIDEMTVDIVTTTPDPLLPTRLIEVDIHAPNWLTTTPEEEAAITAVGTGPYTLAEFVKGSHITLAINPNYWGEVKPTIPTITLLPRAEAAVRAAMVQAGEADIALLISADQAASLPKSVVQPTTESIFIRMNGAHPVLSDVRVREAIVKAVDTAAIREALYPGVSEPLSGHIIREMNLGFNDALEPYPYDPELARSLLAETGAVGQELDMIVRTDFFPQISELAEAVQGMVGELGLKINIVQMETGPWRELLFANKEGQKGSDLMIVAGSSTQLDSARIVGDYFGTGSRSQMYDAEIQAASAHAATLMGDERDAAYQKIWADAYDQYWFVPLFGLNYVHGLSARTEWQPRFDSKLYYNTIRIVE
jgi:peptide/nickel transport system substrate-binding protein